MARKIVLLCILALAISSCKKKYYPNDEVVTSNEIIAFSGTIGGKEVSLNVGSNNYYCFSSFHEGTDSVFEFSSLLAPYDCSTCASSFLMSLSDVALSSGGSIKNVDSTFKIGKRYLNGGLTGIPSLNLIANSNKTVREATWTLQNKIISNNSTTTKEILVQGYSTIQLKVLTESNCENTVESKIWVDNNGTVFFTELNQSPQTGNAVQFTSLPKGGSGSFKYVWTFGDGESSTEANPTHVFAHKGNYPVQLQITDTNNHTVFTTYIVVAGADSSSCALGIDMQNLGIRSVKFDAVSLQWKDEQNKVFSSNNTEQPSTSYFEIISSQPFENNERGEPGRLLTIRFSALLSDGSQSIQANVEKATMAVSYK